MEKEKIRKKTLNEVLQKLKQVQRYDQVWEWMEERKDGKYIKYDDLHEWVLKELNNKIKKELK